MFLSLAFGANLLIGDSHFGGAFGKHLSDLLASPVIGWVGSTTNIFLDPNLREKYNKETFKNKNLCFGFSFTNCKSETVEIVKLVSTLNFLELDQKLGVQVDRLILGFGSNGPGKIDWMDWLDSTIRLGIEVVFVLPPKMTSGAGVSNSRRFLNSIEDIKKRQGLESIKIWDEIVYFSYLHFIDSTQVKLKPGRDGTHFTASQGKKWAEFVFSEIQKIDSRLNLVSKNSAVDQ